MKKQIISLLLVAGFVALTLSCGGGKKSAENAQTRTSHGLTAPIDDSTLNAGISDTLDFGRVRRGDKMSREFLVKNTADKAFVITNVMVSCGCVEVDYPKQPLKPGEEGLVTVKYDVIQYGGVFFKNIIFQTSLSPRPYVMFIMADVEKYQP